MEIRPPSASVFLSHSSPRPTPAPARVGFGEVLAHGGRALASGATAALSALPGGPLIAAAVRGAASSAGGARPMVAAEGPSTGSTDASGGGLEASLQQSQEMNLYYLKIQEDVNAQNRTFSTLSNVMKAEHDTVKTAIGNLR